MSNNKRIGGSLDKAMRQEFDFKPLKVLQEAWNLTKTTFPTLLGALVISLAVLVVVIMLASQIIFAGQVNVEDANTMMVFGLLQLLIMPPLLAAIHVMGIQHSIGRKTKVNDLFMFIKRPFSLIITALITSILTQLAGMFAINALLVLLIAAFLSITLSLALPLVAEYQLSPFQAIKTSFIVIVKRFGSFLAVYALMFILFILAIIPFGLGLIWVAPMFYNVKGILYREVFGVFTESKENTEAVKLKQNESNSDTWSA